MGQETDEDQQSGFYLISGCYNILQGSSPLARTQIEHCCLVAPGNNWHITVKCRRPLQSHSKGRSQQNYSWRNVREVYPDAKVEQKHNDIEVNFPSLREDIEVAAFGRPGREDQKRMQMAIFGRKPTQGRDWKIWVYLVDDTDTACKQVCQKEEEKGNSLLAPYAGMFVSNTSEDIRIEFSTIEPGWKIKGNKVKTIKSKDAWNSPENATDFPRCHFQINHSDETKQSFFCRIIASHEEDTASSEIVAYFERERGKELIQPSKDLEELRPPWQFSFPKETNEWLPKFLSFFAFLVGSGFQTSYFKDPTHAHQHCTTKKAIPRNETLKKLELEALQNGRVKEVY